jgi:hypothetical protein
MNKPVSFKPTEKERLFIENHIRQKHKNPSEFMHEVLFTYIELEKDPVAYIAKRNQQLAEQLRATKDKLEKERLLTAETLKREEAKPQTIAQKEALAREAAKDRALKGQKGKVDWGDSDGGSVSGDTFDFGDGYIG